MREGEREGGREGGREGEVDYMPVIWFMARENAQIKYT